jgi:hypothetical protein
VEELIQVRQVAYQSFKDSQEAVRHGFHQQEVVVQVVRVVHQLVIQWQVMVVAVHLYLVQIMLEVAEARYILNLEEQTALAVVGAVVQVAGEVALQIQVVVEVDRMGLVEEELVVQE